MKVHNKIKYLLITIIYILWGVWSVFTGALSGFEYITPSLLLLYLLSCIYVLWIHITVGENNIPLLFLPIIIGVLIILMSYIPIMWEHCDDYKWRFKTCDCRGIKQTKLFGSYCVWDITEIKINKSKISELK